MKNTFAVPRRHRGFTLVEAIIVMVITGILAGMVAVFLKWPVQSYMDTAARAELVETADLALRRISRELRLALPNSVVQSADGKQLMFVITKNGGRYIDVSDNLASTVLPLDWSATASTQFDMAGAAPSGRQQILAGDSVVVFNIGSAPAEVYSGGNRALISNVSGTRITLSSNPFASQNPQMTSPTYRFQVVTGTVTYVCNPAASGTGTLMRYGSTGFAPSMAIPATPLGTGALLANMVSDCSFNYTTLANTNTAVISIRLVLTHTNGESVTLVRQVHVDNTP